MAILAGCTVWRPALPVGVQAEMPKCDSGLPSTLCLLLLLPHRSRSFYPVVHLGQACGDECKCNGPGPVCRLQTGSPSREGCAFPKQHAHQKSPIQKNHWPSLVPLTTGQSSLSLQNREVIPSVLNGCNATIHELSGSSHCRIKDPVQSTVERLLSI